MLSLKILQLASGRKVLFLIFFCLMVFFWHLGLLPFYTRNEAREGLVVWEMARTGNWTLPKINGDYIPFKPPLFHWMGVLVAKITGRVDEFTIRFPSALLATLGVLLTYFAAARLWNEKAGIVAGLTLATSTEWWNSALIAEVDMTLAFFVTATLLLFYFAYEAQRVEPIKSFLLGALLACATLAKGPIGTLVPALVILVFLTIRRDLAFLIKINFVIVAAVFLLIAGTWYFLAWREGGWAFLQRQILEENFGTARGTFGHYQSYLYFPPMFFFNFLPWSLFIPSIVLFLYQRRHSLSESRLLFPLIWFLSVLLFFTIPTGKRAIYILPLYPAAALLFGAWWSELEKSPRWPDWLTAATAYIVAAAGLLAVFGMLSSLAMHGSRLSSPSKPIATAADFLYSFAPLPAVAWVCLVCLGAASLVIFWFLPRRKWHAVLIALVLIATSAAIFLQTTFHAVFAAERTLKPFLLRVRERVHPNDRLFFYDVFDGNAIFYTRRHIRFYKPEERPDGRPIFLLMHEENWQRLSKTNPLTMVDISEGGGPTGRHREVLVKAQANWHEAQSQLPNDRSRITDEPTAE